MASPITLTLEPLAASQVLDALRRRQADELEEDDADLRLVREIRALADQLAAEVEPEPETEEG